MDNSSEIKAIELLDCGIVFSGNVPIIYVNIIVSFQNKPIVTPDKRLKLKLKAMLGKGGELKSPEDAESLFKYVYCKGLLKSVVCFVSIKPTKKLLGSGKSNRCVFTKSKQKL